MAILDLSPAKGNGGDKIFILNDQIITADYTIPAGQNAMTSGDITVADGVTITAETGSTWTLV